MGGMNRAKRSLAWSALLLGALLSVPAWADNDDQPAGSTQKPQFRSPEVNAKRAIGDDEVEGPTIFEGIPALNPIDDARDRLRDRYGIYLHGEYIGDPYGDLAGGVRRGSTYSGRLDVQLDVNAEKVLGLKGGTLHANMFQIHGTDLSTSHVGNFLSIDDIGGLPSTRLYELWYEQKFGDKLSVRAGQLGIDVEFLTSDYAANFINATFGWPGLPSVDLPDGGPAYPLATPAVRVKYIASDHLAILAAVFDGDPAGRCAGEPQTCDRSGLNFRLRDPPLVIVEAQYRYNQGNAGAGLPGTVKLGGFAHFGAFADERTAGLLATNGLEASPLTHTPDVGFYGILDQQIYRLPGDEPEKGIGVFARAIGAPADRNLVDLYLDAGMSAIGLVPGRPDDLFGIAGAFARISPEAAAADAALDAASGLARPIRNFEAVIELTYQARIIPGVSLQPTAQYIVHPGGTIANPLGDGTQPIRNAAVFGTTLTVRF